MRLILAAALRALLAFAAMVAVLAFLERGMGSSADADIGGPAIAMAATWLPLLAWGWYDVRRRGREPAMRLWLLSGVLLAVAFLVSSTLRHGFDPGILIVAPLVAAVETLPALAGVVAGSTHWRRATGSGSPHPGT